MSAPLAPILCADDEESDGIFLRHAFAVVIVKDGREAVDYLGGTPPYDDRQLNPLPALVILDLKMPRLSGFDVLEWLATRTDLAHIPVVIFSSSMAEADMRKARQLGAKEFIVKPNSLTEYSRIVRNLHALWLAMPTSGR